MAPLERQAMHRDAFFVQAERDTQSVGGRLHTSNHSTLEAESRVGVEATSTRFQGLYCTFTATSSIQTSAMPLWL